MPDNKVVVPTLVAVAVLVAFAGTLGWLLDHPGTAILLVVTLGGGIALLIRRSRLRNRV
jgi:hypothetical protein